MIVQSEKILTIVRMKQENVMKKFKETEQRITKVLHQKRRLLEIMSQSGINQTPGKTIQVQEEVQIRENKIHQE